MGSAITTVGNRAGKKIAVLSAASMDTGCIFGVNRIVGKPNVGDLPPGYRNVTFQLVVGSMSAGEVTIWGTMDRDTSIDLNSAWAPIVSPSSEAAFQWSNPLTSQVGQQLLKTDVPFIGYRATTSADFNGDGTTYLLVMAAP